MLLLATTALEWSWGRDEPLLFLGDWCQRYERKSEWSERSHAVVRNHWDDRTKLRRDYEYLERLHAEIFQQLVVSLSQIHDLERSNRFWRILLDPWLTRYLGAAYDRWETLRVAFDEHVITSTIVREQLPLAPARGHFESANLLMTDDWNHDFFCAILQYAYSDRCAITISDHKWTSASIATGEADAVSAKWRLIRALDGVAARLCRRSPILFVQSYFPLSALVSLNLRLGQVPCLFLNEFDWPVARLRACHAPSAQLRARLKLQREPANAFESFVHARIAKDVPSALMEYFAALRVHAQSVKLNPRAAFTGIAHWFNDPFKHWAAEKVHAGMQLITMDHGGSIHPAFGVMGFEEDIAEVKTVWSRPYRSKQIQMPANKFAGLRRKVSRGGRLLAIGYELPRYSFAAWAGPIGGQTLLGFSYVCELHDLLDKAPQEALLVKPYPDLGWRTRERFIDRLGANKVSPHRRLEDAVRSAKMIICTYPQTTLSEAMFSGTPFILLYAPQHWETVPQFNDLIEALRAADIIFFEPDAAAAHINAVWSSPQAWWESPKVRAARARFHAELLDVRPNGLQRWAAFARRAANGSLAAEVESGRVN